LYDCDFGGLGIVRFERLEVVSFLVLSLSRPVLYSLFARSTDLGAAEGVSYSRPEGGGPV
jgi:hypothetical protein